MDFAVKCTQYSSGLIQVPFYRFSRTPHERLKNPVQTDEQVSDSCLCHVEDDLEQWTGGLRHIGSSLTRGERMC